MVHVILRGGGGGVLKEFVGTLVSSLQTSTTLERFIRTHFGRSDTLLAVVNDFLSYFDRVCCGFQTIRSQRGEREVFAMGAQTSAQRDGKTQEDASAEELSAEVNATQEDSGVDAKVNGSSVG